MTMKSQPLIKEMIFPLDEDEQDVSIDEDDVIRTQYRPLDQHEKEKMTRIKAQAAVMFDILNSFGNSTELTQARIKVAEAVMWACHHLAK